jgi:hypothetical protein
VIDEDCAKVRALGAPCEGIYLDAVDKSANGKVAGPALATL